MLLQQETSLSAGVLPAMLWIKWCRAHQMDYNKGRYWWWCLSFLSPSDLVSSKIVADRWSLYTQPLMQDIHCLMKSVLLCKIQRTFVGVSERGCMELNQLGQSWALVQASGEGSCCILSHWHFPNPPAAERGVKTCKEKSAVCYKAGFKYLLR